MTSNIRAHRSRIGFTLIELLVVMGIIVLLIAIAFPVIGKVMADGKRAKVRASLNVIESALEEYKKDHGGQYPQGEGVDAGFAVLARELVGVYGDGHLPTSPSNGPPDDSTDPPAQVAGTTYKPGDCVGGATGPFFVAMVENNQNASAPGQNWASFNPRDGVDGPGGSVNGRKVAYLPPDRLRVRGCAILDPEDRPILYFPARSNPNISVSSATMPQPYMSLAGPSKFVANDNIHFFTRMDDAVLDPNAMNRIRVMIGDRGNGSGGLPNGKIDSDETAVGTGRYILWAAGPDGFYGVKNKVSTDPPTPLEISKCDDIVQSSQ